MTLKTLNQVLVFVVAHVRAGHTAKEIATKLKITESEVFEFLAAAKAYEWL